MNIISIENLSFAYSSNVEKLVLKDINLNINQGDFIILCGPTGCGKTTLIECINGLIPHFHYGKFYGNVVINGKNTRNNPVYVMSQFVGLVFQNPENQLVSMNVEKELSFALENFGVNPKEIRNRIDDVLRVLNIEDIRFEGPHDLSGGQQQKVAIASILTLDPDIIIFDEPTANLDPAGALRILNLIDDLNKNYGKTIILIEHRLEMLLKYASKIIVMNEGEIVQEGKPEEVIIDELLEKLGLRIPKAIEIYKLLKNDGYSISKIPLTTEELAELLIKL